MVARATWQEQSSISVHNPSGLAFNHDGSLLAARVRRDNVIWQTWGKRWREVTSLVQSAKGAVSLRFSTGSPRLVVITGYRKATLWDTENWTPSGAVRVPGARLAEVSADGLFIAVASRERVEVWRTVDWKRIAAWDTGYDDRGTPLAFSPDLATVVFQGWNGLDLRDTADGTVLQCIPTRARAAALSADGRFLAITTSRFHVWVWARDRGARQGGRGLPRPPSGLAAIARRVRVAGYTGAMGAGAVVPGATAWEPKFLALGVVMALVVAAVVRFVATRVDYDHRQ
ncbi:WD40 repeat domain-containing protein [Actinosynnema sp. CA-248983]